MLYSKLRHLLNFIPDQMAGFGLDLAKRKASHPSPAQQCSALLQHDAAAEHVADDGVDKATDAKQQEPRD